MEETIKILVIGLNPSIKSPDDSAFHPLTKSGTTIRGWMDGIEGVEYINLVNKKMPNNDIPTKVDLYNGVKPILDMGIDNYIVVAVGDLVSKTLTKYSIKHLKIDHPSGLNRNLNDPIYIDSMVKRIRAYVRGNER